MENIFYTYIYLDPRKPCDFNYGIYHFDYEPFYVGKGFGNRYLDHLKYCGNNNLKNNKIRKIKSECDEDIIIIKVYDNITDKEAIFYEIELIGLIGRLDLKTGPLTNLTNGGEGTCGLIVSEETRRKISESHKGKVSPNKGKTISEEHKRNIGKASKGRIVSDETKRKISESNKGKVSPNKGKQHSDEHKRKISETLKGKTISEETKEKISESMKGKLKSKETKEKIGESLKGKKRSEETKQRMREAQRLRYQKQN